MASVSASVTVSSSGLRDDAQVGLGERRGTGEVPELPDPTEARCGPRARPGSIFRARP